MILVVYVRATEGVAMRCPFGRPHPPRIWEPKRGSMPGGGFLEYMDEVEAREAEAYWASYDAFCKRHPTCWSKFLNWLGLRV